VKNSKGCKPRAADSWMTKYVEETGTTPQRCQFFHRYNDRLVQCNNYISTPGWRGCHVWAGDDLIIVPGCHTCNTTRDQTIAMYIEPGKHTLRVVPGETCRCDRGDHRSFGPPSSHRSLAETFRSREEEDF
jgi:hypothetical protein